MHRSLSDGGFEIVGQEDRDLAIAASAGSLAPDAVVMALEASGNRGLCERIRLAAPGAKIILWAADEKRMQVIEPGETKVREVPAGGLVALFQELPASQSTHVEE
jgi:hypothetical protein